MSRGDYDWALWCDSCLVHGWNPHAPDPDRLAQWVSRLTGSPSTSARRVRAVLRRWGTPSPDVPVASRMWAAGDGLRDPLSVLADSQVGWWPLGARDLRDGVVVIATGVAGFSRARTVRLTRADVTQDEAWRPLLAATEVPWVWAPGACPSCWLWAWLGLQNAYREGGRRTAQWFLERTLPDARVAHLCRDVEAVVGGRWVGDPTPLLVPVDRHGWFGTQPLTTRAVTTIVGGRRPVVPAAMAATPPASVAPVVVPGTYGPAQRRTVDGQLGARLDALDDAVTQILARSAALLAASS